MRKSTAFHDIGSPKSPLTLGYGISVYSRDGKWHYRDSQTRERFGDSIIEATDPHMIVEVISHSYQVIYPAHECEDRPNLPCPACTQEGLKALGIRPKTFKRKKYHRG